MSRFDRYLLSQFLAVFGFFALVLVSVYWVNRAVRLFDQLISDGQSALVFLELSGLTLPGLIRLVMPIASFAAVVYVTNRLTQESELVVMQATGFSPWRLARPVVVFGLFTTLIMLVLMNVVEPLAQRRLNARTYEISSNITARFLTEGEFQHPASRVTVYIRDITDTGILQDVFISDSRQEDRSAVYSAERAYIVRADTGPKLVMVKGQAQILDRETGQLAVTSFGDFTYDIGALLKADRKRTPSLYEISTPRLHGDAAAVAAETDRPLSAVQNEAHQRLTLPFEGLGAALIGFAALLVGSFSRFGLTRQILAAIGLLIVVHSLVTVATSAAIRTEGGWPALYLPPLAALAIAGGLLATAARGGWRIRRRRTAGGLA